VSPDGMLARERRVEERALTTSPVQPTTAAEGILLLSAS
jgi:hypothetical protein